MVGEGGIIWQRRRHCIICWDGALAIVSAVVSAVTVVDDKDDGTAIDDDCGVLPLPVNQM